MKQAVFLSVKGDFHADVVGQVLIQKFGKGLKLSIIDMDDRSARGGFAWHISDAEGDTNAVDVMDNNCNWISLDKTDFIWCRRFTRSQRGDDTGFLTKQWNSVSWTLAHFTKSKWIDLPRDIVDAENKPVQLHYACESGFFVPNTLVSQDPVRIQTFFQSETGGVIVKPLKASINKQIFTVDLLKEAFDRPNEFRSFPAIYQQKIGGNQHLRIVCLPTQIFVFLIKSNELDWRKNINIDIQIIETDSSIAKKCTILLSKLKLSMGIIDAKIFNDKIYFLEINPQGQFLFLEALTGVDLKSAYAEFFLSVLD